MGSGGGQSFGASSVKISGHFLKSLTIPIILLHRSAADEVSSRLREAESLAQRRHEALTKIEKDLKTARDALIVAEEERDEERRKTDKWKEEAEEKAEGMEHRMETMKQRLEAAEREKNAIQVDRWIFIALGSVIAGFNCALWATLTRRPRAVKS